MSPESAVAVSCWCPAHILPEVLLKRQCFSVRRQQSERHLAWWPNCRALGVGWSQGGDFGFYENSRQCECCRLWQCARSAWRLYLASRNSAILMHVQQNPPHLNHKIWSWDRAARQHCALSGAQQVANVVPTLGQRPLCWCASKQSRHDSTAAIAPCGPRCSSARSARACLAAAQRREAARGVARAPAA